MPEIREIQKLFMEEASGLGEYGLLTKTELANGYCDADEAKDERKRSQYWAALMLRYFYKIFEWAKNSQSCRLPLEEFVYWLNDSLVDAFYYRSWRWEYEAVVRNGKFIEWKLDENGNKIPNEHYWKVDPNAPDKSINYFCAARRGKEYQALNKQKRKGNVLSSSLDASMEETGDYALYQAGGYEDSVTADINICMLVKKFVENDRLIEALIIDGIVAQDTFKETKTSHVEYSEEEVIDENTGLQKIDPETGEPMFNQVEETVTDYNCAFDKRKLIRHLNSINQQFMIGYFSKTYDIPVEKSLEIFKKLQSLNNTKLYKYIEKTLINLKTDPDVIG